MCKEFLTSQIHGGNKKRDLYTTCRNFECNSNTIFLQMEVIMSMMCWAFLVARTQAEKQEGTVHTHTHDRAYDSHLRLFLAEEGRKRVIMMEPSNPTSSHKSLFHSSIFIVAHNWIIMSST